MWTITQILVFFLRHLWQFPSPGLVHLVLVPDDLRVMICFSVVTTTTLVHHIHLRRFLSVETKNGFQEKQNKKTTPSLEPTTGQELRTNSLAQSQSVKQLGDEEWWRRGIRDLNIDDDQWKELWLTDWMCRQWEDEDYTVSATTTAAWTGKRPAFDLDDAGHNIMRRYATATYNIFIFIGVRTATITTYCWLLCLYNTGPA